MQIEIREKRPTGKSILEELALRFEENVRSSNDMRLAFTVISDELKQAFAYTFSSANPSGWGPLSAKYRSWKIKKGYPATIGILTGTLKSAMTSKAVVNIGMKKMSYAMNESLAGYKGKSTGVYGFYFNRKRNIAAWARNFINSKIAKAVKNAVTKGWKDVG